MGMDGCLDWFSLKNLGLGEVWNDNTPLHHLYEDKYSDISRADFWVIAANAVVKETSVDNRLDLVDTFYWGREDRDECRGSSSRLPSPESCRQVEAVFLERMGLTWRDAVALLGAHTLGRGHSEVSSNARRVSQVCSHHVRFLRWVLFSHYVRSSPDTTARGFPIVRRKSSTIGTTSSSSLGRGRRGGRPWAPRSGTSPGAARTVRGRR